MTPNILPLGLVHYNGSGASHVSAEKARGDGWGVGRGGSERVKLRYVSGMGLLR